MSDDTSEYMPPRDRLPVRFRRGLKNLFFDWGLVEPGYGMPFWERYQRVHGTRPWLTPQGVRLATYSPTLGPSVADDEPSGQVGGYSTLLLDRGVYRLYHETYGSEAGGDLGAKICLLESDDCKTFSRPEVGLIEYDGNPCNNIVFGKGTNRRGGLHGGHGGTVFLDEAAPPSERYKLVFMGPAPVEATLAAWVYGAVSPDGLDWRMLDEPLLRTLSDTQNVCARVEGGYRLYLRGWSPQGPAGGGCKRIVRVSESQEFKDFPAPREVMRPLASWGPWRDIYTTAWQKWPGAEAELMLPTLYDRDTDTTEIHLAVSRDGLTWDYPTGRALLGGREEAACQTVYAGVGIVSARPGEWTFPVHVSEKGHNEYRPKSRRLHLATIREDGFAAIEADLTGGFTLVPALLEGEGLFVNGWTRPGGSIRVRLLALDSDGGPYPLPGFDFEDMEPLCGDLLWKRAAWKGGDLLVHDQRTVRVEFELVRARIFAFRVE